MKHLVLVIGIVAVSVWRSARKPRRQRSALSAAAGAMAGPRARCASTSRAASIVTVMAVLFFWGIGRVPLAQAIA